MDQSADRRGALHGVRKPDIERNLGRFTRRAQEEKNADGRQGGLQLSRLKPRDVSESLLEIQ